MNCIKIVVNLSLISFLFLCSARAMGQSNIYSLTLAPFCTPNYGEFSPQYYNQGLIFCSNRKNSSVLSYQDSLKSYVSMFYVELNDSLQKDKISFFSPKLTTQANDGPATLSVNADTIIFSRNLWLPRNLRDRQDNTNRIGIFMSHKITRKWQAPTRLPFDFMKLNIKEKWQAAEPFPYNNPAFSNHAPALSQKNKRLFFSSNRPGGFGGYDLYYSDFSEGKWQEPVNLGPLINTPLDESFPYADRFGKLYFSSTGHPGMGGYDLFYTQLINNKWTAPIHLDEELNSSKDDFGLISHNNLITGYVSSNRNGSDDIFKFSKNLIQFENCSPQKENKFCFEFFDERIFAHDTINPIYEWDFGENIKVRGEKIIHCFPKEGSYSVVLSIINPGNGDTINNPEPYTFELQNREQAFISADTSGYVGAPVLFDARDTNLPDFNIEEYYWDFGEGFDHQGISIKYSFENAREYKVKLGLVGKYAHEEISKKICVFKTIKIMENNP